MICKHVLKTILISLIVMGIASVILLLGLGVFTYIFKWQAAQSIVGITLTYIISGLIGGMIQGVFSRGTTCNVENVKISRKVSNMKSVKLQKAASSKSVASNLENSLELRERITSGLLLGTSYMLILLILSIVFAQNANWDITRVIVIWILLVCSSVLGGFLSNIFCKKH